MKQKWVCLLLMLSLLLTGCSFMKGNYVSVTPHQEQRQDRQPEVISAENYIDMVKALTEMIGTGTESATINVAQYPTSALDSGMAVAIRNVMENDPIGAYAVQEIRYELGTSAGQPAVAVEIDYLHDWTEIRKIKQLKNMEEAKLAVQEALEEHLMRVVFFVQQYKSQDFSQLVQNIAEENPHLVMETPQVFAGIYGTGGRRVVELKFTYQNSRDSLRQMQRQVGPVFESAVLYVSEDASQWQKYSQLYGFLMERFEYTIETSITPAYSLLHHGVGDNKTFAVVYSAMCRAAGLECMVVNGTRSGIPWSWNIICDSGYYYHVDLLRCSEQGRYMEKTDGQMQGYVWDYSAYPVCIGPGPSDSNAEESGTPPHQTEPAPEETQSGGEYPQENN